MKVYVLEVPPIGTNCFILCDPDSGRCAVIDPGGGAEAVISAVEESACTPDCILLTHGHYDHTGAAKAVSEHFGNVPIYLNERDVLPDGSRALSQFPRVGGTQNCDEGDTISVGSLKLQVLATPGHSRGSVTFRCGDLLFCGDTLFAGSCGRTDLYGGSMDEIMRSLARLGALEGDLQVLPGHMEMSTMELERRRNPYLQQALRMYPGKP